jgi:hypothetical protein
MIFTPSSLGDRMVNKRLISTGQRGSAKADIPHFAFGLL